MASFTRFVAYYSYKGGVGRSLALANTAFSLAAQGHKVLIIDMDFEAPGQHMTELFLRRGADRMDLNAWPGKGMLELLEAWMQHAKAQTPAPFTIELGPYLRRPLQDVDETLKKLAEDRKDGEGGEAPGEIWLMASGQSADARYAQRVRVFDWKAFSDFGGGSLLDGLKHTLGQQGFDYVLIDTRTGYSQEFLVAGLDLADTIVVLTSYNRQNIEGTRDIVGRVVTYNRALQEAHQAHLCKRLLLVGSPIPLIGDEAFKRRLSHIKLQWPELGDFRCHLPYVPELALDEQILCWEYLLNPRVPNSYAQEIQKLHDLIVKEDSQVAPPLHGPLPTNPFADLRGGHIDSADVVRYFVDPGGNIVADMGGFTPLVITGARGTGKTMLARRFCVDEWLAEQDQKVKGRSIDQLRQIGLYFNIDADVLHSFNQRDEEARRTNDQLFTFFFDIIVVRKAVGALEELGVLENWTEREKLLTSLYAELGEAPSASPSIQSLLDLLEQRLTQMRLHLNNPKLRDPPIVAAPNILIKRLVEYLRPHKAFKGRYFAIHVDEFESFEGYQQRILNTRLKNVRADECVTYRFYMRSGGFRTRATLAPGQSIENTHDFRQHSLDEELSFETFKIHAIRVANRHLELSPWFSENKHTDIGALLQDLSAEEEAAMLEAGKRKRALEEWVERKHPNAAPLMLSWFRDEPSYLWRAVAVVVLNQGKPVEKVVMAMRANDVIARSWYHNYKRGALHWLCRLHHQDKRYAGLNTLVGLAGNNVRVFIDFCHASFSAWLADGDGLPQPLPIDVAVQDRAVKLQARILRQNLYSASRSGPEVNRFLERFGRLCEAVHKSPRQSEPEVNHFSIKGQDATEIINKLLRDAWYEGVVRQLPGNKQKTLADERQDDWQLAPWLGPLFNLSSRRKKKMTLTVDEVSVLFSGTDDAWKKLYLGKEAALEFAPAMDDELQGGLFDESAELE